MGGIAISQQAESIVPGRRPVVVVVVVVCLVLGGDISMSTWYVYCAWMPPFWSLGSKSPLSESPSWRRSHVSSPRPWTVAKLKPTSVGLRKRSRLRGSRGLLPIVKRPVLVPLPLGFVFSVVPRVRAMKRRSEGTEEAMQPMPVSMLEQSTVWATQTFRGRGCQYFL